MCALACVRDRFVNHVSLILVRHPLSSLMLYIDKVVRYSSYFVVQNRLKVLHLG